MIDYYRLLTILVFREGNTAFRTRMKIYQAAERALTRHWSNALQIREELARLKQAMRRIEEEVPFH